MFFSCIRRKERKSYTSDCCFGRTVGWIVLAGADGCISGKPFFGLLIAGTSSKTSGTSPFCSKTSPSFRFSSYVRYECSLFLYQSTSKRMAMIKTIKQTTTAIITSILALLAWALVSTGTQVSNSWRSSWFIGVPRMLDGWAHVGQLKLPAPMQTFWKPGLIELLANQRPGKTMINLIYLVYVVAF